MSGSSAAVAAGLVMVAMFLATVAALAAVLSSPTTTDPVGLGGTSAVSGDAVTDIPAPMLALYQRAAASCPGLDWAVLAAVGKVETDHGRSPLPGVRSGQNQAGAAGPMQFLAPTFAEVTARRPPPPGGARPPSRYNAHDSIHTAAAYLCDSGARTRPAQPPDIRRALYAYNHSSAYVDQVLAQAQRYRAPAPPASAAAAGRGGVALAFARRQLGQPYVWGGDGPDEGGFDCSGLTTAAWSAAGITIPRTAHTQHGALTPVPIGQVRPGDLFFFGTAARVHHVGIATGKGTEMVHAPNRRSTVRLADARALPDLLSAAHPA